MVDITKKEFDLLSEFIRINYGIYLRKEKQSLVIGRLSNILEQKNFKSFTEYYNYVISDKTGEAVEILLNKITTNHTFFMRESDHFIFFKDKVLPYLVNSVKEKDLRVWSAGCSTGEEPYTLAMLIRDYLGSGYISWDTKILATDISQKVLEIAMKGEYGNDKLSSIPTNWLNAYFKSIDANNRAISESIKKEVVFRKFNLMENNFPFKKKFHVIFCRNVMIYFNQEMKSQLIDRFYKSMENGGYLFIGHSETLNYEDCKFNYVMPAVYRKE